MSAAVVIGALRVKRECAIIRLQSMNDVFGKGHGLGRLWSLDFSFLFGNSSVLKISNVYING